MRSVLITVLLGMISISLKAQKDGRGWPQQVDSVPLAPYQKFPNNPPIDILLLDSVTRFKTTDLDKQKPVVLMIFSPDCDHCQHETEAIIKNIDSFKDVQIVMVTWLAFAEMKSFYKRYELDRFPNIVMGHDTRFMLPPYFGFHNLPFMAFYDKKKKFVSVFEGSMPVEKLIERVKTL